MQLEEHKSLVTIISPVHNEQESIPIFYERLYKVFQSLADHYDYQILFTNNRSTDLTSEIIHTLHEADPRVEMLTLSRNFGYQASVLSGLTYARGDLIMVIDVDCEDPPELLPLFLEGWRQGYDIVYGIRSKRMEFIAVQWMRKLFYRLLRATADSHIILDMAEFALISATVRDHVIDNFSTFPFIRTDIGYVGFERKGIEYQRQMRVHGKSHYNFITMAAFAIGGILSSSTYLLRLGGILGAVLVPLNLLLMVIHLNLNYRPIFDALVITDLTYVLAVTALIGLYVARIYKNDVRRPIFIVDWRKSIYNESRTGIKAALNN